MLPVNTVLPQYLFLSASCFLFWAPCAAVLSSCFALLSLSPWRHIKRPETEAGLGASVSLLSHSYPLFLVFLSSLHPLSRAGTLPVSLPSPNIDLFPSDSPDRKQRAERGNDLSSALSLSFFSFSNTWTGRRMGWGWVHLLTKLPLNSVYKSWILHCSDVSLICTDQSSYIQSFSWCIHTKWPNMFI